MADLALITYKSILKILQMGTDSFKHVKNNYIIVHCITSFIYL